MMFYIVLLLYCKGGTFTVIPCHDLVLTPHTHRALVRGHVHCTVITHRPYHTHTQSSGPGVHVHCTVITYRPYPTHTEPWEWWGVHVHCTDSYSPYPTHTEPWEWWRHVHCTDNYSPYPILIIHRALGVPLYLNYLPHTHRAPEACTLYCYYISSLPHTHTELSECCEYSSP